MKYYGIIHRLRYIFSRASKAPYLGSVASRLILERWLALFKEALIKAAPGFVRAGKGGCDFSFTSFLVAYGYRKWHRVRVRLETLSKPEVP